MEFQNSKNLMKTALRKILNTDLNNEIEELVGEKLYGCVTRVWGGEASNTGLHWGTDSATAHAGLHPERYRRPWNTTHNTVQ